MKSSCRAPPFRSLSNHPHSALIFPKPLPQINSSLSQQTGFKGHTPWTNSLWRIWLQAQTLHTGTSMETLAIFLFVHFNCLPTAMHIERWGMCGCVGVWACWTADLQHELWPWSEPGAIKGNFSLNQPPSGFLRAFPLLQWSEMLNFWVPILNELNTLTVSHSQCFSCMSETRVWFHSCILHVPLKTDFMVILGICWFLDLYWCPFIQVTRGKYSHSLMDHLPWISHFTAPLDFPPPDLLQSLTNPFLLNYSNLLPWQLPISILWCVFGFYDWHFSPDQSFFDQIELQNHSYCIYPPFEQNWVLLIFTVIN